jgi:TonB family protein
MTIPIRGCLLLLAGILAAAPRLHAQAPADSMPRSRHIAVSEAVDSAGLAARLQALPELPTRRRAVVGVAFTPSGQVDSVVVRTADRVSPELLPLVEEAIRASVRAQPRDTLVRRTTLALRTGRRVSLSEPETSKPMLRNAPAVGKATGDFSRRNRGLFADGPKAAMVTLVVRADGRPEGVRLAESSGVDAVDAEALRIAQMFRFEPAVIEGEAVPVLLMVPVPFFR